VKSSDAVCDADICDICWVTRGFPLDEGSAQQKTIRIRDKIEEIMRPMLQDHRRGRRHMFNHQHIFPYDQREEEWKRIIPSI
jgi:hypothetical protein